MAPPDLDHLGDSADWARLAAGEVAVDVAAELSAPLGDLRDRLAMLVDRIDRHVAYQTGPEPYPWKQLQALRQDLAAAYLETTTLARLAADLASTVGALGVGAIAIDDVEHLVEAAVQLGRHRIAAQTELLVDAGVLPAVYAPASELVLAIARMVGACALSAAGADRASLAVRTRAEEDGGRTWVVITTSDNGGGAPAAAAALASVLGPFAHRLGGSFDGTSQVGQGSAFELRLPAI
jgi:signal transduction histidine kinase